MYPPQRGETGAEGLKIMQNGHKKKPRRPGATRSGYRGGSTRPLVVQITTMSSGGKPLNPTEE